MKKISFLLLISFIAIGCSEEQSNPSIGFEHFENKILGYDFRGQEETWFKQEESVLTVYTDALIFKSNRSMDLAFIGFGYGYTDLSVFDIIFPDTANWSLTNNQLTISLIKGGSEKWEILDMNEQAITFRQESTQAIIKLNIMEE